MWEGEGGGSMKIAFAKRIPYYRQCGVFIGFCSASKFPQHPLNVAISAVGGQSSDIFPLPSANLSPPLAFPIKMYYNIPKGSAGRGQ